MEIGARRATIISEYCGQVPDKFYRQSGISTGDSISRANTHPHYSPKNAGQCHSVGPKWPVLYIVCEYSVQ